MCRWGRGWGFGNVLGKAAVHLSLPRDDYRQSRDGGAAPRGQLHLRSSWEQWELCQGYGLKTPAPHRCCCAAQAQLRSVTAELEELRAAGLRSADELAEASEATKVCPWWDSSSFCMIESMGCHIFIHMLTHAWSLIVLTYEHVNISILE